MFGKVILFLLLTSLSFSLATDRGKDCKSPPDSGRCKAYLPRYYHDTYSHQCRIFIYGGCGGNRNRYKTIADCLTACSAKGPFLDCTSPPVTGPCRAEFKRYNYNTRTKQCEPFIYGGCKGNGNRYKSEQDCLDACSGF
ncbi:thrombin inhibitor hemalin-like isoform X2 [Tachypleus tridentatus]|uniref:thrombin inhibitor hemalin-like isoform X2 n=1 Tax=Tachypleus tridentatus TaxID=6853 RepID=UPI003FD23C80